uniref:Putative secreted protein n=1 Tax=Ixodes ricinus TaxID=34613 RepID=A0A6B0U1X4_IXORI
MESWMCRVDLFFYFGYFCESICVMGELDYNVGVCECVYGKCTVACFLFCFFSWPTSPICVSLLTLLVHVV